MLFGKNKFPTEELKQKLSKLGEGSKVVEYSKDSITLETTNPRAIRKALKIVPDGKDPYPFKPGRMDMAFRLRVVVDKSDSDAGALIEKITKLIALKPEIDFNRSKKRVQVVYEAPQIKVIDVIYEKMFKQFPDRIYWADVQLFYDKPEKEVFLTMERPISDKITPLVSEKSPAEEKSEKKEEEKPGAKPKEEKDTRELAPEEYLKRIDTLVKRVTRLKKQKQQDLRGLEKELSAILKLSSFRVASLYLKRLIES